MTAYGASEGGRASSEVHQSGFATPCVLQDHACSPAAVAAALNGTRSELVDLKKHGERVSTRGGSNYSLALAEQKVVQPKLVQPKFVQSTLSALSVTR